MWGILESRPRAARLLLATGLLLTLAACATHHPDAPPPAAAKATTSAGERDATGAYRFNMTQNGRRMTADEFDAWMKARGIRVATGAPAATKSGNATAQARAKARPVVATAAKAKPAQAAGKASPTVATAATARPKPATVAQAAPKARPKSKPAAKEVSVRQGKPADKQATGEG